MRREPRAQRAHDGERGAPPVQEDAPLPWTGVADKASYYRLFVAYILALLATGVATVALALLPSTSRGTIPGAILGTALSLKMLAYIVAAPVVGVVIRHLPRKPLLIALDVLRAGSLLVLPFVTATWQVLALVFVFALASAVFTLVYQTVVPYLLANQEDYTKSLARSRIATELESSISPLLAAGLLLIFPASGVFVVAAVGVPPVGLAHRADADAAAGAEEGRPADRGGAARAAAPVRHAGSAGARRARRGRGLSRARW